MNNIIKLAFIDFKNIIKTKSFWIGCLLSLLYISIWIVRKPDSFSETTYQYEFFKAVLFVFIYYSSVLLAKEFSLGTSKTLFTGTFSRFEIVVEKLLVFLQIGLFFGILSRLLHVIFVYQVNGAVTLPEVFNINTLQAIIIYVFISFVIGSFGLFAASITVSFKNTLIFNINIFGVIQYLVPLFIFMNIEENLGIVHSVISKLPQYITFQWTTFWHFNVWEILTMIIWGNVFLIPALLIIDRRSLR